MRPNPAASLYPPETGLLFVEAFLRSVVSGGRGRDHCAQRLYLGNRSDRYVAFRRWLLGDVRIAVIIVFPRFTFKRSGADVSAPVVVFETVCACAVSAIRDSIDSSNHRAILGQNWKMSRTSMSIQTSGRYVCLIQVTR